MSSQDSILFLHFSYSRKKLAVLLLWLSIIPQPSITHTHWILALTSVPWITYIFYSHKSSGLLLMQSLTCQTFELILPFFEFFFPFCHWPKSLFTLLTFSPHFPLPSSSSLYGYLYLWHFMIFLNVSTWHSLHGRSHHFIKGICTCNFSKVVFHFSPITTSKSPSAYCPFIFSIITRKKNYNLSLHIDGREEIKTKSGSKTERNENKIIFTLLLKSLK